MIDGLSGATGAGVAKLYSWSENGRSKGRPPKLWIFEDRRTCDLLLEDDLKLLIVLPFDTRAVISSRPGNSKIFAA